MRTLAALSYVKQERLEVIHLGAPLDPVFETQAMEGMQRDPRYRWLGGVPHGRALKWLASSHAMVISSRMEGGANVVCEALRIGVPVLASRISGNIGLLGAGYRGYFSLEDDRALARLIGRAAADRAFYRRLKQQIREQSPSAAPQREAQALLTALRGV